MSEEVSLDNVLSGESVEVIEAPLEEIAETVTETVEPTVDATVEDKTEPVEVEPTSTEEPADYQAQLKAQITKAQDEKGKRQAIQRQLEQIQAQAQAKVETPDPYAEPDKAIDFAVSKVEQRFQNKLLDMSELNAKNRHESDGDFSDMTELFFNKLALDNPALNAEALAQVDPYEFIYRTAKNHSELSQMSDAGGMEAYKANLEKELRAKWDTEQAEKTNEAVEKAITASIPGSLSTQRAAGGNKTQVYTGDQPLSKIVGS